MSMDREKEILSDSQNTDKKKIFEAYRRILVSYFFATILVILILGTPAIIIYILNLLRLNSGHTELVELPALPFVALLGALGAFFSALARLYKVEDLPAAIIDPTFREMENKHLLMYALLRPFTGMIAAAIFYLAIASGIISGSLFPDFKCFIDDCSSLSGTLYFAPATAPDNMKALVWGFVAGFSERLVPDALANLTEKE